MYAAMLDGTLELGERLNDDELVRWLGVSRTPVREAIAKLGEQGLVDIEANRYTRIVKPSFDDFIDTVTTGYEIWALCMKRGVPKLSDADLEVVVAGLDKRADDFAAERLEDMATLVSINERVLDAAASPVLSRLWATTGPLMLFVFRRASARGAYPWKPALTFTRALRDAVAARDGQKAFQLVDTQTDNSSDYFEEVRALGIYPEV